MTAEIAPPLPPAAPDVSVVVPHFRDFVRLDLCLAALVAQRFAGTYEIIVADNNSPEGLTAVAAAVAGRAQIVVELQPGAGPARNRGAAAAAGRVLAFIDSDCLPDRDWLATGVAAVTAATIVGGRVEVLSAGAAKSPIEAFEAVFAFDNETYVRAKGFSVTANLFVPAAIFARVGPFPVGVSEDIEWCWRARDAGIGITFVAGAVVGHPARRDFAELDRKWRRLSHELFLLEMGRGRSLPWYLARTWLMFLALPLALVRIARSPLLAGWRERAGAARVLIHNRVFRLVENQRIAFAYLLHRRDRTTAAGAA